MGTLLVREASAAKSAAGGDAVLSKEAEKEYEEALRLQPELAQAHFHLGVLLFDRKSLEEASAHLAEATRVDANNAQALFIWGKRCAIRGTPKARFGSCALR